MFKLNHYYLGTDGNIWKVTHNEVYVLARQRGQPQRAFNLDGTAVKVLVSPWEPYPRLALTLQEVTLPEYKVGHWYTFKSLTLRIQSVKLDWDKPYATLQTVQPDGTVAYILYNKELVELKFCKYNTYKTLSGALVKVLSVSDDYIWTDRGEERIDSTDVLPFGPVEVPPPQPEPTPQPSIFKAGTCYLNRKGERVRVDSVSTILKLSNGNVLWADGKVSQVSQHLQDLLPEPVTVEFKVGSYYKSRLGKLVQILNKFNNTLVTNVGPNLQPDGFRCKAGESAYDLMPGAVSAPKLAVGEEHLDSKNRTIQILAVFEGGEYPVLGIVQGAQVFMLYDHKGVTNDGINLVGKVN